MASVISETRISDLSEDVLMKIFKQCDFETLIQLSDTCKLFNDILHRETFGKMEKYEICIEEESYDHILRKVPTVIGRYLSEFNITYYKDNDAFLESYFQILSQHLGKNIRKLTLKHVLMTNKLLEPLKPILNRLTTLKDWNFGKNHSIADLQKLCPNLVKLSLNERIKFENSVTWPTLTRLSLKHVKFGANSFRKFIALNPQIVALNIDIPDGSWLAVISKHLPNLEKLTFNELSEYYVTESDIRPLKKLKRLTKLCLPSPSNDYGGEYYLGEFLNYLATFVTLREIKFIDNFSHDNISDHKPFANLAKKLPLLEKFYFPLYNPDAKSITRFVRHAKSLKELYIGLEDDDLEDEDEDEGWFKKLVDARKSHQLADEEPLKFLIEKGSEVYSTMMDFSKRGENGKYLCVEVGRPLYN